MKREIQTGAKIQLGGVNNGFFIAAYHVGIEGVVKKEPRIPATWQITSEAMSLNAFDCVIFFLNHGSLEKSHSDVKSQDCGSCGERKPNGSALDNLLVLLNKDFIYGTGPEVAIPADYKNNTIKIGCNCDCCCANLDEL